jgi:outer membrane protein assembly factor BamD
VYSLDQTDTDKALDKLQNFIDTYPNSTYLAEANAVVKELKFKIEKKAFENAKQYNTISDFKAAQIAFDNFISDFPGTIFKEDALYYRFDSAYQLAINSVPQKMEERLNSAKAAYNSLIKFSADSKHKAKADQMLAKIEKDLQQYSK